MLKRYYDTKICYTNSYNIFDLKSLHLKTKTYAFKFRIRIRMIFFLFRGGVLINGNGW